MERARINRTIFPNIEKKKSGEKENRKKTGNNEFLIWYHEYKHTVCYGFIIAELSLLGYFELMRVPISLNFQVVSIPPPIAGSTFEREQKYSMFAIYLRGQFLSTQRQLIIVT